MDDLKSKILDYIEFYNKYAKPFKWKYEPKTNISIFPTKAIKKHCSRIFAIFQRKS